MVPMASMWGTASHSRRGLLTYWALFNFQVAGLFAVTLPRTLIHQVGQPLRVVWATPLAALGVLLVASVARWRTSARRFPWTRFVMGLFVATLGWMGLARVHGLASTAIFLGLALLGISWSYRLARPYLLQVDSKGMAKARALGLLTGLAFMSVAPGAVLDEGLALGGTLGGVTAIWNIYRGSPEPLPTLSPLGSSPRPHGLFVMAYTIFVAFAFDMVRPIAPGPWDIRVSVSLLGELGLVLIMVKTVGERLSFAPRRLAMVGSSILAMLGFLATSGSLWWLFVGTAGLGITLGLATAPLGEWSLVEILSGEGRMAWWAVAGTVVGAILWMVGERRDGLVLIAVALGLVLVSGTLTSVKKDERRDWSVPLVLAVAAILKTYARLHFRLKIMGSVPKEPYLIVANHAHDADSIVLPVTLALDRGVGRPLISSGSMRLFEPGFLAERMGDRFGRWVAWFNVGPILWWLGVRPIEDSPLNHSLRTWGYFVYQSYGNLPLKDVFVADALERGGDNLALRDLWSKKGWDLGAPRHSVTVLAPAFRGWMKDQTRRQVQEQMALLTDAAIRGLAVYCTPEGRLTLDGRLTRFRASLTTLLEHPPRAGIAVLGTSYDLMVDGRMHVWSHFATLPPDAPIRQSVSAARPITASHIVAQAWQNTPQKTFETVYESAHKLFEEMSLTPITMADDLRAVPERLLKARSQWLCEHLKEGQHLTDRRFPYVTDFIAYYCNQLAEIQEDLIALAPSP